MESKEKVTKNNKITVSPDVETTNVWVSKGTSIMMSKDMLNPITVSPDDIDLTLPPDVEMTEIWRENGVCVKTNKAKEELSKKWIGSGLLDGLTGPISEDIAKFFQGANSYIVHDDPIDQEVAKINLEKIKRNMENRKKKTILVDMDGVIADFNKKLGELAPDLYLGDGDDYEARSKRVDEICSHTDNCRLFKHLEPIGGGIEAVKMLAENHEIYFCSTPMSAVLESYMDKAHWLRKYFGDWANKRLILTHRKDLVHGDYLIDDRIKNGVAEFKGVHIHFGTDKFPTWDSVLEYFNKYD